MRGHFVYHSDWRVVLPTEEAALSENVAEQPFHRDALARAHRRRTPDCEGPRFVGRQPPREPRATSALLDQLPSSALPGSTETIGPAELLFSRPARKLMLNLDPAIATLTGLVVAVRDDQLTAPTPCPGRRSGRCWTTLTDCRWHLPPRRRRSRCPGAASHRPPTLHSLDPTGARASHTVWRRWPAHGALRPPGAG